MISIINVLDNEVLIDKIIVVWYFDNIKSKSGKKGVSPMDPHIICSNMKKNWEGQVMKNVKRYRFFLVLLCVTIFSEFNFSNVMASDPTEKIVSEEYVMKQREEGKLRYGESEKVTVVDREYKSYEFIPDGQPPGGKSIESGGGIWIIENKGSTIELSASLAWEVVSFSVNVGLYSEKATDDGTMV